MNRQFKQHSSETPQQHKQHINENHQDHDHQERRMTYRQQLGVVLGQKVIEAFLKTFPEYLSKIQKIEEMIDSVFHSLSSEEGMQVLQQVKKADEQYLEINKESGQGKINTSQFGFILPLQGIIRARKMFQRNLKMALMEDSTSEQLLILKKHSQNGQRILHQFGRIIHSGIDIFMSAADFAGDYYYPTIYQIFSGKFGIVRYPERENCTTQALEMVYQLPQTIMHGGVQVSFEQLKQYFEATAYDYNLQGKLMELYAHSLNIELQYPTHDISEEDFQAYLQLISLNEDEIKENLKTFQIVRHFVFQKHDGSDQIIVCEETVWINESEGTATLLIA